MGQISQAVEGSISPEGLVNLETLEWLPGNLSSLRFQMHLALLSFQWLGDQMGTCAFFLETPNACIMLFMECLLSAHLLSILLSYMILLSQVRTLRHRDVAMHLSLLGNGSSQGLSS